ncbi:MAG: metallophosphoesterase [Trueperaceae bacterium]|nr:metallophosphoesterase [Trueperaceae bacterium]
MHLVVVGDIHTQAAKLWRILREADLADDHGRPSERLSGEEDVRLVLLGDLVHAKSRERYADLAEVRRYDEYNPRHLRKAEVAQEAFLRQVQAFQAAAPEGRVTVLLGNHDHNAIDDDQGPLRTDDVSHFEWKPGYGGALPEDLKAWIAGWPRELVVEGLHLAHVGPLPEHNTFDQGFYLENRRRWIYEDEDVMQRTPYRMGVYGHTPVRGGVNVASQGRAILLDTNGHGDEYAYLDVEIAAFGYRLRMRGLFFDELIAREAEAG